VSERDTETLSDEEIYTTGTTSEPRLSADDDSTDADSDSSDDADDMDADSDDTDA
jgi:hypothetical protein